MIKSKLVKKIGYAVLDIITFGNGIGVTINNFNLKLPTKYFRLFPSDYEKENFGYVLAKVKQDDVVLDIGAHIGLMSVVFGKKVGRGGKVYCFEPTPISFGVLNKTIEINSLKNIVTPVNAAVSDKTGTASFFISDTAIDVGNSMVKYGDDKETRAIEMRVVSIDDFVNEQKLNKLDFIKIDAEGAEYKVLQGGMMTIKRFQPLVLLALHPEAIAANSNSLELIYDLVKELGYTVTYQNNELQKNEFCKIKTLFDVHLSLPN